MSKTKTCKECQLTKDENGFYQLKGKQYKETWNCRDSLCKVCRLRYSKRRVQKLKQQCVEYLGGRCMNCSLETTHYCVYDFHHRDPSKKDFNISKVVKQFNAIKSELDKCDLLCSNCHRILHYA